MNDIAFREAKRLAESIWRKEYQKDAPNWSALDTTEGIISQIDNMYAGMREQRDIAEFKNRKMRCALEDCAKAFRQYEAMHQDKGTVIGMEKAMNNARMARVCENLLS